MLPVPGHLAAALILSKLFGFELPFTLFATYFPDVFDKIVSYLSKRLETGRAFLHSLFGVFIISLLIWLIWGREWALAWALIHFFHLICDSHPVPWLYPFRPIPVLENIVFVVSFFCVISELVFLGSGLVIYFERWELLYNRFFAYAVAVGSLSFYIVYNYFLFKRFYIQMTPEQRKRKSLVLTY